MQVDLQGKVALVTGAGRGIGKATADLLAANHASVAYTDIDSKAAHEAAGPDGFALRLDVADQDEVERGVAAVLARYGHLDILVNNAGINTLHHRVNIDLFPLEEWDRIVRVDLTGLFLMSKAAAAPMIALSAGRILNIAPGVGLAPLRLQSAFVALEGSGVMTFAEGRQEKVEKGMFVYLPPWCEHGIENTGTETLVVLIATSPPNP